ncbi:MAG: hypothetical protein DYH06_15605 [Acidobacteria bacterium ACB2]|nr:hypothetical protein [Acidobacteria bacterium ACB2]
MGPAADAVPGIDAWSRMFSAAGAQGVQGETVERLADSARGYAAFLQSALGALEISWSRRPDRVRAGERFEARVTLANRGSGRVSSDPPWPVHLSYRWFDRDSGEVVVLDGARSLLLPPLALDERRSYPVGVEAPARPGSYRLLVTLVQEGVAWLSDRAAHLGLSADVEVEAPTAPKAS